MRDEELNSYMEHIRFINKELAEYVNMETGVKYIIPLANLLCRIEYIEASDSELKTLLFNRQVDKLDYKTKMVKRPVVKSTITHDKSDDKTLVDSKIKAYQIWNVSNGLNIRKSFADKNEAIKLYDEITDKILNEMGV